MPEGGGLSAIFNIGAIDGKTSLLLGSTLPWQYLAAYGQWWRLITAIFLHGSLMHIVFNMWVIMDIGPMVEELFGSARYLFLYVATGAFGYVIRALAGHNSVGASGSLLGLIGLLPRVHHAKQQRFLANAALQFNQMDHLYRHHGLHVFRN